MTDQEISYMLRALSLVQLSVRHVSPNPLAGAVLVHKNKLNEVSYHEQIGLVHAEVNCFNSGEWSDKKFIPEATLFLSLEPCIHFGRTRFEKEPPFFIY